jgi:hypothetical protein
VAQIDHFFVGKDQTLATKNFSLCTIFTTTRANPSPGGARGHQGEATRCLGQAEESSDKPYCPRRSEQAGHHHTQPSGDRRRPRTTLVESPPRAALVAEDHIEKRFENK